MECLKALEERITQQELDSMYLVLDMKPERGSLQEQLYAVRRFLTMQKRYDAAACAKTSALAAGQIRTAHQEESCY